MQGRGFRVQVVVVIVVDKDYDNEAAGRTIP
jgi:hypothetical protein